jgi:hypothetical protein
MIRIALFMAVLAAPILAHGASPTANLSVNVIPATSGATGNCPTTPPAEAQRAGYTTLAYCLDGGTSMTASLSNWIDCNYGDAPNPPLWLTQGTASFCDTNHWSQGTDPATGKTTLHFHWYGSDLNTWAMAQVNQLANTTEDGIYPAQRLFEIRWRSTGPNFTPQGQQPGWDFFSYNNDCFTITPACNAGGDLGHAPLEKDVLEITGSTSNSSVSAGFIDWAVNGGNELMGPISNYIPNYAVTDQHTYAMMITSDGTTGQHYCEYIDDILIAVDNPSSYNVNCAQGYTNYPERIVALDNLNLWMGGGSTDADYYIEYIAVWTCDTWRTSSCVTGYAQ